MAYRLAFPHRLLSANLVFYDFMLQWYTRQVSCDFVFDSVELSSDLAYEEELIAILDRKVWNFSTKDITSMKVQWWHLPVGEATWEIESDMRAHYPHIF